MAIPEGVTVTDFLCTELFSLSLYSLRYAGFDAGMPSEWEAWLRHRRDEPPTDEQVLNSLAYAEMKKMNAARLEEKRIEELKAEVSA